MTGCNCCDYRFEWGYARGISKPDFYVGGLRETVSGNLYAVRRRLITQWDQTAPTVYSLAEDNAGSVWTMEELRIRRLNSETGALIDVWGHGGSVVGSGLGIAADAGGHVTAAGSFNPTNTITVKRFNPDGTLVWQADSHGTLPLGENYTSRGGGICICNDAAGNSIIGNRASITSTGNRFVTHVTALNSAGTIIWSTEFSVPLPGITIAILCVAVAPNVDLLSLTEGSGIIYAGGAYSTTEKLWQLDRFGTIQWSKQHTDEIDGTAPVFGVAVDSEENVYAISRLKLAKYDTDGNLVWSSPVTSGRQVAVTRAGKLITAHADSIGSIYQWELDGSGQTLIAQHNNQLVALDIQGGRFGAFGLDE